ncbi:MAG: hypothetical protein LKF71_06220 [Oscillospiraceae bacterium]|jgi:hypothetical protein|nr:hypothetical protein [Oscillospiraceae bacterium]
MKQTVETEETIICPEITFGNLDISKVDKSSIVNDFCDCLEIPLVPASNETLAYEFMFCHLVDKIASNFNDILEQPHNLYLLVDDDDGERKYYIGADIQLEDCGEKSTEVSIEEVSLTDEEQAVVELALLKITNPEQFF